jgi:hypothetical protein
MSAIVPIEIIENKIFIFRDQKVMIDRDLAELYGVQTKVLNQAVKRNIKRFPDEFMFKLNDNEKNELVTNCDRFKTLMHSTSNPYAFTETNNLVQCPINFDRFFAIAQNDEESQEQKTIRHSEGKARRIFFVLHNFSDTALESERN